MKKKVGTVFAVPRERDVMTVSEAARELGVAAKTVRVWSDAGKLDCQRTQSGYRVYDVAAVQEFKRARAQ